MAKVIAGRVCATKTQASTDQKGFVLPLYHVDIHALFKQKREKGGF